MKKENNNQKTEFSINKINRIENCTMNIKFSFHHIPCYLIIATTAMNTI